MLVRPRALLPEPEELGRQPLSERRYLTRREYAARYGAAPKDLAAVADFATEHGLRVRQASAGRRSVVLTGPAARMEAAFRTRLSHYRSPEGDYRGRSGHLHVPASVAPAIEAVLGLDDRPQATTSYRVVPHERVEQARRTSFTPSRIAELYDFPRDLDGSGQRIAVIELGGGFLRSKLRRYFEKLGKPMPKLTAVSVDGVRNSPGRSHAADGEVVLDIEVIGAIAPGAEQLVYFAPASDRGFVDAVTTALFDPRKPSILSISWGQAEEQWTEQGRRAMDHAFRTAAALGVTVCAAAGDNGWRDGVGGRVAHVDYPASSPHVLACGGTHLEEIDGGIAEVVWNDHDGNSTGGGVSALLRRPVVAGERARPRLDQRGRRPRTRRAGRLGERRSADRLPRRRRPDRPSLRRHERRRSAVGRARRPAEPAPRLAGGLPQSAALREPRPLGLQRRRERLERRLSRAAAGLGRVHRPRHAARPRAARGPQLKKSWKMPWADPTFSVTRPFGAEWDWYET